MNEKYIKDFINNLSVLKDVQSKSELIKDEIQKLNKMIRELNSKDDLNRLEKLNRKLLYSEILAIKSYLSLKLSFLDTEDQKANFNKSF